MRCHGIWFYSVQTATNEGSNRTGHGERLKSTEEELLLYKFISIVPREEGGAFRKVKEKVRFLTGWHKRPGAGGH